MGAEALRDGLSSGMSGLIKQPVRGAMQSGAKGAVRGVGLGLAGVLPKFASGIAGFASKVTEGMGAEAKRYTPGALEADRIGRLSVLRIRQPRLLADRVLRAYPRTPPLRSANLGAEAEQQAAAANANPAGPEAATIEEEEEEQVEVQ